MPAVSEAEDIVQGLYQAPKLAIPLNPQHARLTDLLRFLRAISRIEITFADIAI